jgi:dienelactone hydrolase
VRSLPVASLALFLLCFPVVAQQSSATGNKLPSLQTGVVLPRVTAAKYPEQTYALYLPSRYVPEKRWPIIYAFDPGARGKTPVELMKDAAERHGYILAGSNNSRNGSWKIEAAAAQAMLEDTQDRLSIDLRRAYFAGFSGGARVAARLAQLCKCAAGVLLNGAGFQPEASALHDGPFAVFAAVGTYDFNYGEVVRMEDDLERLSYAHSSRRFDGPHQWAPAIVMEEALAWFRLQAMKKGLEKRDDSLIAAASSGASERARSLEQSGNLYAAWREYRQGAETFVGLADNALLRTRAEALEKDKVVREGAKREKQEFEEQDHLTNEISTGLSGLRDFPVGRAETSNDVPPKIIDLRNRAAHEKREEKLRVLKRALAGVMVQAMEMGFDRLEQKDPARAKEYFELACEADPDSAWALSNLAVARAQDGDRKGVLEALRRAKAKTKDLEQFSAWLGEEPAFAQLRGTPEFNALLQTPPQH